MNITGAHAIIYSTDAEADRALLRDVFKFKHVDAGDGWLILALPPAEARRAIPQRTTMSTSCI